MSEEISIVQSFFTNPAQDPISDILSFLTIDEAKNAGKVNHCFQTRLQIRKKEEVKKFKEYLGTRPSRIDVLCKETIALKERLLQIPNENPIEINETLENSLKKIHSLNKLPQRTPRNPFSHERWIKMFETYKDDRINEFKLNNNFSLLASLGFLIAGTCLFLMFLSGPIMLLEKNPTKMFVESILNPLFKFELSIEIMCTIISSLGLILAIISAIPFLIFCINYLRLKIS